MPYKGGVQLLPETQRRPTLRSYTSGNSYFYFALSLGAVILVISAILGGYKANLKSQIAELDGQMETSEKSRDKAQEQQLIDLSKQSKIMRTLLDNKIYWSQALQHIQEMMQTSVMLTGMQATAQKGVIKFEAKTDSYASVAKQLASFVAATGVTDIVVHSITTDLDGVKFSGDLMIDPKVMLTKPLPK